MIGAIAGDIIGSRFEANNLKSKNFELFTSDCRPTDDTNMTIAIAQAFLDANGDRHKLSDSAITCMKDIGRAYPYGYGAKFWHWIHSDVSRPYESWGNGAAMRVSPCAWVAASLDDALDFSDRVTKVTHNHPEGMKGARAVTAAIWMARHGSPMYEIREHINKYYYKLDFTLDDIRDSYEFHVSCQKSVPQAIEAFLESTDFEDAIRNAVSIGGDSDTIAAIAGSIAEAYYGGIPNYIRENVMQRLDEFQKRVVQEFEEKFGSKIETAGRYKLFTDNIKPAEIYGLEEINKGTADNMEKALKENYDMEECKDEVKKYKNICRILFNRCRAFTSFNEKICPYCEIKAECEEMNKTWKEV